MSASEPTRRLTFMQFVNAFSILVVFGSISTAFFFTRIFYTNPDFWFYYILGSTVWVIYTLDHIFDGFRLKTSEMTLRHELHYTYRKTLIPISLVLGLSNVYLAYLFLPINILIYGAGLGVFVGLYFVLTHIIFRRKPFFGKEIAASLGAAFGMVLLPFLYGQGEWNTSLILIMLTATFLNLTNLMIFGYFEKDYDEASGFGSMITSYSKEQVKGFTQQLMIATFLTIGAWGFLTRHEFGLYVVGVFMFMLQILARITIQEDKFAKNEKYRFWGDFIYIIPGPFSFLFMNGYAF